MNTMTYIGTLVPEDSNKPMVDYSVDALAVLDAARRDGCSEREIINRWFQVLSQAVGTRGVLWNKIGLLPEENG